MSSSLITRHDNGVVSLHCPVSMPLASAFLWNPVLMMQMNCRGFATAQFMQPEPSKYAHAPNMEAKTFMQPEQAYFAHHPGRFFYIQPKETGELYSMPHEPVRNRIDEFGFHVGEQRLSWSGSIEECSVEQSVRLHKHLPVELWEFKVENTTPNPLQWKVVPYFPMGYMSWMNQSAEFDKKNSAILAKSITPYQKVEQYFQNRELKDITFLMSDRTPVAFEARQSAFEGEGGLQRPDALRGDRLGNSEAFYETPTAAMQFDLDMSPGQTVILRFAFGAAKSNEEITQLRNELLCNSKTERFEFSNVVTQEVTSKSSPLRIETPNHSLNHFVNHWLGRQIYYHGEVNRMTTDPQTRNFLQDHMGMTYLSPERARASIITAISQQKVEGAMPDGILLHKDAELKYINQVPHMDHCVWLPLTVSVYVNETGDESILDEFVSFADDPKQVSVFDHVSLALDWLFSQRDERGLNFIAQGDWNDPMNMVGYKGKGVSAWLTLASAYAFNTWADVCRSLGKEEAYFCFSEMALQCNESANKYFWTGEYYARGITDDGRVFGVEQDQHGKIFLNPQAWAILSGAADEHKISKMLPKIEQYLETDYGVQMLAPAFTSMVEDIGRVTQKYPGSAENGSIYNHAAAFYIFALLKVGQTDKAVELLCKMIPSDSTEELIQRGQLPVFVPNYYRGAVDQFPSTAGRSSQLFNTGTVHWLWRSLTEELVGLRGVSQGLRVQSKLPSYWNKLTATRRFRGASFEVKIERVRGDEEPSIKLDGEQIVGLIANDSIKAGERHHLEVRLL